MTRSLDNASLREAPSRMLNTRYAVVGFTGRVAGASGTLADVLEGLGRSDEAAEIRHYAAEDSGGGTPSGAGGSASDGAN
ncbi:hypothetical protein HNR73_000083 [Phytomonospora endophytica]|uniref:Uncharacterized protein n=1 Tax=Phytomonospora endophytica TaxID=714109 RepID=A0A841F5P9_9ACTN|nr:hypothetical protein [Phytomonospora endophytica]GIG68591.1 hypothetical protein Pen01_48860 [Phytomonospora endophytica]